MKHVTNLPEEQPYIVQNLKEIIQILTDLAKHKATFKVSFSDGHDHHDGYLTSVIEVDTKNHAVHLDVGIDEAFNSKMLASNHVIFTKNDGIKIKWSSENLSMVSLKDGKAIKIAIPQSLVRLQRREFFRLNTPIVNPAPCRIPIPDAHDTKLKQALDLALVDISLGGLGVVMPDPLHSAITEGANFDECEVSFPEFGSTSLKLQVKNIMPMQLKDGSIKYRIGFQFVNPSRNSEELIRRYTFNLERLTLAITRE